MSRSPARHRKQPHSSSTSGPRHASRHRKQPPARHQTARIAAAAAGSALIVTGWAVAAHWPAGTANKAALDQADGLSAQGSGPRPSIPPASPGIAGSHTQFGLSKARVIQTPKARHTHPGNAAQQHDQPQHQPAVTTAYRNPLRAVNGLLPERIDQGVDFGGAGPVYALGDAVVTNATGDSAGWPGGGWITYQLTDGPDKGLQVYLAEDVTPTVQVGQHVTSATVIANMFNGGDGIETGWAMPDGSSAESQLPEAGGISGAGPFPTAVGMNFEELLQHLGVAAAPNRPVAPSGTLPSNYPTSWD